MLNDVKAGEWSFLLNVWIGLLEQPQFSLGFRERVGEERRTECLTIGVGILTGLSFNCGLVD